MPSEICERYAAIEMAIRFTLYIFESDARLSGATYFYYHAFHYHFSDSRCRATISKPDSMTRR